MFHVIKENERTIAISENARTDAYCRVKRRLVNKNDKVHSWDSIPHVDKLMMDRVYKAKVKCAEDDTYSDKQGEIEAVKKAMANHKRGFDKAMKRWQVAVLKDLIRVSPDTFEDAVKEATAVKRD